MMVALLGVCVCSCSERGLGDDGGESTSDDVQESSSSIDPGADDQAATDEDGPVVDDGPEPLPRGEQWLLAVAVIINPQTPLQWHVVGEWTGSQLDATMQSLELGPGSTTSPRTPVGDATPFRFVVDERGGLSFTLDVLRIAGMANPITGSEILADDVTFAGRYQIDDVWCGTVTGTVTQPLMLDLTGSTFAAVPIDSLDALPVSFPSACE